MDSVEAALIIPEEKAQLRLDKALADLLPQYSRAKLVEWLKAGSILVDGERREPKSKVMGGECVILRAQLQAHEENVAQDIPLDIIFEDSHLLVLNKPANLVVHPAAGHQQGTLLNGLLNHCSGLEILPRAGIVHRLDKDTTGLMVVAKTLEAHHGLVKILQAREIERHYVALVQGALVSGGTVETMMGRHPVHRTKMAVTKDGKEAVTHYRLREKFAANTLLDIKLETGRTHQIRVHMNHIGHPCVGDPLYGGRAKFPKGCTQEMRKVISDFNRQALHAYRLSFEHPITGESMSFEAPIPEDFTHLLAALR